VLPAPNVAQRFHAGGWRASPRGVTPRIMSQPRGLLAPSDERMPRSCRCIPRAHGPRSAAHEHRNVSRFGVDFFPRVETTNATRTHKPLSPARNMLAKARHRLALFIHSSKVQTFLTLLLLLDVVMVIVLLEMETEYPSCENALNVCKDASKCIEDPARIDSAKLALAMSSRTILVVFVAEILLLVLAVGLVGFLREPLYVFDGMVVFASAAIELTVGRHHRVSGLLVFARAWRFIALLHSMNSLRQARLQRAAAQVEQDLNANDHSHRRDGGPPEQDGAYVRLNDSAPTTTAAA
jgi:hypothetical protein